MGTDGAFSPIFNENWEVGVRFDSKKFKEFIEKWDIEPLETYKYDKLEEKLKWKFYAYLDVEDYEVVLLGLGYKIDEYLAVDGGDIFYISRLSMDYNDSDVVEFVKDLSEVVTEKFYLIHYPHAIHSINTFISLIMMGEEVPYIYLFEVDRGDVNIRRLRIKFVDSEEDE